MENSTQSFICQTVRHQVLHNRRSSGFTLIEMLVVIALTGVILAIGIPSFTATIERNNVSSQINDLTSALHYARSQAIARGSYVTVCRTRQDTAATPVCDGSLIGAIAPNDWGNGYMVFVDDNSAGTLGTLDTAETVLRRIPSINSKYKMLSTLTGGEYLVFNSQGYLTGGGGRFKIDSGTTSTSKTVCLDRGGRIRTVTSILATACN